jgi:hypothetical protein
MILAQNAVVDFLAHTVTLLVLGIYLRSVLDMKTMNYVMVAVILAAVVTFINRVFFPALRMQFVDYRSPYFMCPICAAKGQHVPSV